MTWNPVALLRGPAGRDGEGAHHEQRFTGDTASWLVQHNLGSLAVIVGVYASDGTELLSDVVVLDENTVRVDHDHPMAGTAVVQR